MPKGFPDIAPGGKVDFPESIVNGAIREVREETGLIVRTSSIRAWRNRVSRIQVYGIWCLIIWPLPLKGNCWSIPEGELLWVDREEALKAHAGLV